MVNNDEVNVDSTSIKNEKFMLNGKVNSPYLHTLIINNAKHKIQFFLKNNSIDIFADINNLKNAKNNRF